MEASPWAWTDRRSDNRQRRVHVDGGGNLGSRPAGVSPRGLVSAYTGTGSTVGHPGVANTAAKKFAEFEFHREPTMTGPVSIARCLANTATPNSSLTCGAPLPALWVLDRLLRDR